MIQKLLLTFLFGALFASQTLAQTGSITGTVTNEEGDPVPTANVLLVEVSRGAATNLEGEYTIADVEPGTYTLRITFIGYTDYTDQVTIQAGQTLEQNVTLQRGAVGLEELIVTGFGRESKVEFSGSAAQVDVSQSIDKAPVVDVTSALQGSVTGLQISASSGTPGAAQNINIRGISSINANGQPLFVIDGVPVISGDISANSTVNGGGTSSLGLLASLNPQTIESVTVLKGPVATAQYGARGSNGVIVITTKRGVAGETRYSFSLQRGTISNAVDGPEVLSAEQSVMLFEEALLNGGSTEIPEVWDGITNTNWKNVVANENALTQSYMLSAAGGTDQATFYGALNYQKKEGIIINSNFQRMGGRLNFSYDFNEDIDVTNQFTGSYVQQNGQLEGAAFFGNPVLSRYFIPATVSAYNDNEEPNITTIPVVFNPVYTQFNSITNKRTYRVLNSTQLNMDILDNLTFHSEVGLDFISNEEKYYDDPIHGDGADLGGTSQAIYTRVFSGSLQNGLSYLWDINADHSLEARVVGAAQIYKFYRLAATASGFATLDLTNLASASVPRNANSAGQDAYLLSVLGKVHYGYGNKIFIDATLRQEGNSRFSPDYRWGTFYAVGATWLISQEGFLRGSDWLDLLKIKASYGITGNDAIGLNQYQPLLGYGAAYGGLGGSIPVQLGYPQLTWEKAQKINIGLTFGFFNRIDADVNLFHSNTYDLLYDVPLSETSGFQSQFRNVGELVNRGIEFSIDFDVIQTEDFLVNINSNFTYLQNEITELPVDATGTPLTITSATKYGAVEGYAVGSWYMPTWAGVNPENGLPLWEVNDGDDIPGETTSVYSEAQPEYQGASGFPTHFGSVGIRINYKGFFAGASLYGSFGNKVYDAWGDFLASDGARGLPTFNQYATQIGRWQEPGDITDVPKRVDGGNNQSNANSSRYLYDGDYLRLQMVRLGYDVPVSFLSNLNAGVRGVTLYLVGRNLWTHTFDPDLKFDPDVGENGVLNLFAPARKAFTFGINIQF